MEGGEEVWTTDKEARGRAERKQRYMDTMMGGGVVYRPETQIRYILQFINSIRSLKFPAAPVRSDA